MHRLGDHTPCKNERTKLTDILIPSEEFALVHTKADTAEDAAKSRGKSSSSFL